MNGGQIEVQYVLSRLRLPLSEEMNEQVRVPFVKKDRFY